APNAGARAPADPRGFRYVDKAAQAAHRRGDSDDDDLLLGAGEPERSPDRRLDRPLGRGQRSEAAKAEFAARLDPRTARWTDYELARFLHLPHLAPGHDAHRSRTFDIVVVV